MARFLPDTNVWLALTLSGHPHHEPARAWLDATGDADDVVFCRATQQSLLRLLTTSAVFVPLGGPPLTNREAWAVADALLADVRISLVSVEPPGAPALWRAYSSSASASPKLWMDAYLAAFARASGAVLVTNDRAFRGYPDLAPLVIGETPES